MINPDQFREIFQSFPDPCLLLLPEDPVFTILEVNRTFELSSGISKEILLGDQIQNIFNKHKTTNNSFQQALLTSLKKVMRVKKTEHISELRYDVQNLKSGELAPKFWQADTIPILNKDGIIEIILVKFRDITTAILARGKNQRRLLQSKHHQRPLIETKGIALIGTWEIDINRDILYWSPALRQILQVGPDYAPNLNNALNFCKTNYRQLLREAIENAIKNGDNFDLELEIITLGNQEKWVHMTGKVDLENHTCKRVFGTTREMSTGAMVMDITKEERDRQNLQLNLARQQSLLENQTYYVIRIDNAGRFTYFNEKFKEAFGWLYKEKGFIGENFFIAVMKEDHPIVKETTKKCRENPDKIFQVEIKKLEKNGTIRTILWDFIALTDSRNTSTEIQCTGIDVSKLYEAELELKQAKEQYYGLLQSIDGIFWEMDAYTFQFTFVSHQASAMTGYKPEQWYHEPLFWQEHIHPDDREDAVNFCISQTRKGKNHSFEYRMRKADGSYLWLSDVVSVIYEDGKPRWLRGVMTDISPRKEVEEQLQLREQRFKHLVQEGGDLIAVLDEEGDYKYVSPTSVSVLGFAPEDFYGQNIFKFIHSKDIEKVKKKFGKIFKKKRIEISAFRFKHHNGSWRWLETTVTEMLEEKAVQGIVCNSRDITERKRYYDLENLERKVLEMNFGRNFDLTDILKYYVEKLEEINLGSYCVVQKLSGNKLFNWTWGKISSEFLELLNGRGFHEKDGIFHLSEGEKEVSMLKIKQAKLSALKNLAQKFSVDSCWSYPIVDSGGKMLGLFSIFYEFDPEIDKKQRKRRLIRSVNLLQLIIEFQLNEKALQRSNQRYEYVNKATNDAIYDWDISTDNVRWGEGFYRISGYHKNNSRYPLEKWAASVHPDDLKRLKDDLDHTLEDKNTNKWNAKYCLQKADGNYLDIMENGYIIRDEAGKAVRMIGVLRDITDIKIYEKELEQANERYRYATKATSDAIWDYDLEHENVFWGAGFEMLFGYKLGGLKTDLNPWYENIHPEDRQRTISSFKKSLANSASLWEEEYRFRNINGDYLNVYDRGYVVRDENGMAKRMVGAMQDITRKKQYEVSLQKLNRDLNKRAKELTISNAELEQFAYVASHDLQEPLRMVTSFLKQLEKKYAPVLDDKGLLYIDFAVDGAKRMRQIILDLLEFSRVGRKEDKLEEVDLNQVIDEVKNLYRNLISEQKVLLKTDSLPEILAPKSPLRQVFQNLIGNAIKYSQKKVPPEIFISHRESSTHWEFSVKDNGIGIEKEYFDRIFVLFQRLHRRDQYSGTGMGLALTKKIIENLGGHIWVESKIGDGSSFYFTIRKDIEKM